MFDYSLEHLFSYVVSVEKPQMIGPLPEGIRAIFYVTKGEITGPKLRGRFLPGGGDWLTVRTDGVGILDVRATLESDDGALIYIAYTGVGDLGEDGYQKFTRRCTGPASRAGELGCWATPLVMASNSKGGHGYDER